MGNKLDYSGRCKLVMLLICLSSLVHAQEERRQYFPKKMDFPENLPPKKDVWIFIMAGQSNMAGRGVVEPPDTLSNSRILTINRDNEIIIAKEPLHFYEPNLTGLDCGVSFARELIRHRNSITILLVPAAVGGSSSTQWLGDSLHRNVRLLSNFKTRVEAVKKYGTMKGILWHQGETDASKLELIRSYQARWLAVMKSLRDELGDVPIVVGELGQFLYGREKNDYAMARMVNEQLAQLAVNGTRVAFVSSGGLNHKGDVLHLDSPSLREFGRRYAHAFLMLEPNWK